jgi:hypothetical protein
LWSTGCIRRKRYISQCTSGRTDLDTESPGAAAEQDLRRAGGGGGDHQQRHRHARAQPDLQQPLRRTLPRVRRLAASQGQQDLQQSRRGRESCWRRAMPVQNLILYVFSDA